MNTIKVNVNFKNRTIYKQGVDLTSGDYNSTKLEFKFDRKDGRKVFEMKDPDGNLVLLTDIINDEVDLVGKDENGNNASLFKQEGKYIFEISLYDGDSKLTSAFDYIKVRQEQVIVGDEIVTTYLPIFDKLISEVENLNIEVEGNTLTITKKDGSKESTNIQGPKGDPGAIKMQFLNQLPGIGFDDTLYFIPAKEPTEANKYDEYAWANNDWEYLGSPKVVIDLTDYQKKSELEGKDLLITYEDETAETIKLVVYK